MMKTEGAHCVSALATHRCRHITSHIIGACTHIHTHTHTDRPHTNMHHSSRQKTDTPQTYRCLGDMQQTDRAHKQRSLSFLDRLSKQTTNKPLLSASAAPARRVRVLLHCACGVYVWVGGMRERAVNRTKARQMHTVTNCQSRADRSTMPKTEKPNTDGTG